ncbi:hypothetical protein AVEN_18001-1 [Araneus ventricosus]|uniref:Uncharacterized protein n=1 Tax=Araneus ventricosus TaxID=182803 RepID=A0A4Y2K655_ARAVE|nr:hypothetical protein AVEN_18001-1 [Araneus ventricosus]
MALVPLNPKQPTNQPSFESITIRSGFGFWKCIQVHPLLCPNATIKDQAVLAHSPKYARNAIPMEIGITPTVLETSQSEQWCSNTVGTSQGTPL